MENKYGRRKNSTSSMVTSEEEESNMETTMIRENKKRKNEDPKTEEEIGTEERRSTTSDSKKKRTEAGKERARRSEKETTEEQGTSTAEYIEKRYSDTQTKTQTWKEQNTEDIMRKIVIEADRIMTAVGKEVGTKISFTRADQTAVRGAVVTILSGLAEVAIRQIELERKIKTEGVEEDGNKAVKGKKNERREKVARQRRELVSEETEDNEEQFEEVRRRRRQRTYAEVSKKGKSMNEDRIEGRVVVPGREGWKTPPPNTKEGERALIVTSKEERNARKLAEELAKRINVKDIGGAPQAVRPARQGRVVIVPKDRAQQSKIVEMVGTIRECEVKETKKKEPLVIISGVEKGMSERDIIEQLERGLGGDERNGLNEIRIIRRMSCRNPWRENVIVRMGVNDFKAVVKRGRVELGCMLYYAEEYLGLAMCFRCCRFGHVAKHCGEKEACYRCGGTHDGKECKEGRKKCVNCLRRYGKLGEHGARDNVCPALNEMLAKSRKNVAYGP